MANGLKIIPLADEPKHIPVLAEWFVDEWGPYYGSEGPGDALDDLTACTHQDALPSALVALGDGGVLVGTAALRPDSVGSEMAPGPWLSGLLVHPDHRRQGVGNRLVEAIEALAGQLGLEAIYVSTDAAEISSSAADGSVSAKPGRCAVRSPSTGYSWFDVVAPTRPVQTAGAPGPSG